MGIAKVRMYLDTRDRRYLDFVAERDESLRATRVFVISPKDDGTEEGFEFLVENSGTVKVRKADDSYGR